jgi:threonine dehydratase
MLVNPAPRYITASTGNHGLGVATAASLLGSEADVVVPVTTPEIKIEALLATGHTVHVCGEDFDHSVEIANRIGAAKRALFVPSFDHRDVVIGHSRLFQEARSQVSEAFERVYVPIGGGGLLAAALSVFSDSTTEVVGVELSSSPAMSLSLMSHHRIRLGRRKGEIEGLQVRQVGQVGFEAAVSSGCRIVLVNSIEVSAAMATLFELGGFRVEGAGAVSMAGVFCDDVTPPISGGAVLCVLTGGNIGDDLWRTVVSGARILEQ